MFKQEGDYPVRIDMVRVVKGRFPSDPDRHDIEVHGANETENGSWYGSLSGDWIKNGHHTGKREAQRTLEVINEIAPIGTDLSRLGELVGKDVEFCVKQSSKGYMNVAYINTHAANVVDPQEAQRALALMLGGAPQGQNQQQQQGGGFVGQQQNQQQPQNQGFIGNQQTGYQAPNNQQQGGGFMPNSNQQQQGNPWGQPPR